MITRRDKIQNSGWAILSLILGATLGSACGDPFSNCDAHRSCPTTGGASGEAGAGGVSETGGRGGAASGNSGVAGDDAAGGAIGETSGGQNTSGGANGGFGATTAGGNETGGTGGSFGATSAQGGTTGSNGGAANGGESAAGAGGSAGDDPQGGSGGAGTDPCDPNPCAHSGTCVAKATTSTCECAKGFTGDKCELWVFEGIGVIDGISIVSGVSGDGKTLTGRSNDSAIVWTSATGIQTLEKLTGYADCSATGISDDGNVQVGICGSASKTRPVRWVQKKVEPLDAQGKGWASAVNADGSVIVGYLYTSPLRPFRWTASSGLVEVPALSPTLDTYGFATNNDGSIVIGLSGTQGFRWSIGSNPESLGTRDCTPMGANADGSVIVGDLAAPNGKSHAFRWTQADGLVDLGVLSTDPETHAWDANADGTVIVGESGVIEGGEALLWTKSAGLQPLKSVLASAGADLTGWRVGTAFSVSANGKIIVGTGTHDGHSEGWIARLP